MSMYRCDTPLPGNEQLAQRIPRPLCSCSPRARDTLPCSQKLLRTVFQHSLAVDLKQEGVLALPEAVWLFAPSVGIRLLTYATPAIEVAIQDCTAQSLFCLSLPLDR